MTKDLFNRYIWLIDTIYAHKRISYNEINKCWQRSSLGDGNSLPLRTFHNHREAIEQLFDIIISCEKGGEYRYYIENIDDLEKDGIRNWILSTFSVRNIIENSDSLRNRILFDDIPSGKRFLASIIEAMRDGVTIRIRYHNYQQDRSTEVEVRPYCLKSFKHHWYVLGVKVEVNEFRIYALDRIEAFTRTSSSWVYPEGFEPQNYFANAYGTLIDNEQKLETVLIKASPSKSKYLRALPAHSSQKEMETGEGYAIFEYRLVPTYDFFSDVLSHGPDLEILSPQWVRDEIASILEKTLSKYH